MELILLKLKHASNRPVYFRDSCTCCLQCTTTKSSRITFQPTNANLLSSQITQHNKFTKAENLTKTFSSENVIETNNIFASKGKKTLPISIACMKTRHTIRVTKHRQLNKFLTVRIKSFSKEP